jgi:hypothetical protein
MTPQFLRAEAARFREMAESADREASRARLLGMATDCEARAAAAPEPPPRPAADPVEVEAAQDAPAEPEPATNGRLKLRLNRKSALAPRDAG